MAGGPQPIGEGGGPNPPYGEDFFNRIVGVHWREPGGVIGEPLAVEFSDEPSYLTSGLNLAMGKVTISVWFRIPAGTAEQAKAANGVSFGEYSAFNGVIPLLTWGQQITTVVSTVTPIDSGAITVSGAPIVYYEPGPSHSAPLQPSCLGVYAGYPGDSGGPPVLDVNILTNVHASGTGLYSLPTGWTGDFVGIAVNPPNTGKPIYTNVVYTMTDFSYAITEEPEYFGNDVHSGGYPEVAVDEWHHLLISWDLQSGLSKMWCAVDNVNKDGNDLPAMCDVSTMGPNEHVSQTIWIYGTKASAGFDSNSVPSNPVQTPGPPTANRSTNDSGGTVQIAPIGVVELAELQVFAGVALDASSESNRRAFIDCKRDGNGNPTGEGVNNLILFKPVDPAIAAKMIGKKPEILLHGSTNWIKGVNLGLAGLGKPGDFKPTGPIVKYLPDPSL